jgi:hypothetical protein
MFMQQAVQGDFIAHPLEAVNEDLKLKIEWGAS